MLDSRIQSNSINTSLPGELSVVISSHLQRHAGKQTNGYNINLPRVPHARRYTPLTIQ